MKHTIPMSPSVLHGLLLGENVWAPLMISKIVLYKSLVVWIIKFS